MEIRYHPLFERWLAELAETGDEAAVVLLGGDKTRLGNQWYPVDVNEAEARLDSYCRQRTDTSPIVKRGNR